MVKRTLFPILILVSIILALFYLLYQKKQTESFTPGIRKLVRPHLRSMRLTTDEYKNALKDQAGKLFNMFGLQFA
jgi:hypothetical protein